MSITARAAACRTPVGAVPGILAQPGAPLTAVRPDARPRSRASTARPGRCSPTTPRTPPGASSSPRAASPPTSSATSPCRWSPASGRRGRPRRAGLPGPSPVRVPRPPRHADRHRLPDLAHGRRRSATYVERLAARLPDVRRRRPVTAVAATTTGSTCGPPTNVADASTGSSSPPTPTRRWSCWPTPLPRRRRDLAAIRVLGQRHLAAPGLLPPARAAAGARLVELPDALVRRPGPQGRRSATG